MKVILYTTLGCHLCEQAHAQLLALQSLGMDLVIESVEIADRVDLMDRYGVTIPVVSKDGAEINWPFSIDSLRDFLLQ